ncbi:MAG TPA: DNA methyltransferase [Burkholderiaceae bacterium]|nr:DNA methyltransferase [Burkholderiaceae bacterium]
MPELVFKGKEYVYNHHLGVPYRPLVVDPTKGIGPGDLNSSLVIHGDNLHALKALLPRFAGQVDVVFIDPPYNTGNEGWCYSDGVNSPIMKEWLSTNPVDGDDLLRHDKWLCMMWPRLVLLRELLSEQGSIWITLDDHEVHHARAMLDELFGEANGVATCVWQKNYAPKGSAQFFSEDHDYVLVYAKNKQVWRPNLLERTADMDAVFKNPDNDPRGLWRPNNLAARNFYSKGTYAITCPGGRVIDGPPTGSYWRVSEEKFKQMDADGRIWWGESGNNVPAPKIFLSEVKAGRTPQTLWFYDEVGHTQDAKRTLLEMGLLQGEESTITPKPVALLERVLALAAHPDALVLDSFAGSGTTAHAVLKANAHDGGNRRFILIEGEDYADRLTAERVRRAIQGYAWVGTQRETLLEERITWKQFQKAEQWMQKVKALEAREGFGSEPSAQMNLGDVAGASVPRGAAATPRRRFDKLNVELKDGVLRVEGEKRVSQMADGLGGEFTYCTLGEPLTVEGLFSGQHLPSFEALGAWLFHTATGGSLPPAPADAPPWYLGEAADAHVWLIYQPDVVFLKSAQAALNLSTARAFADWGLQHPRPEQRAKKHLVFAPVKYLSQKQLAELRMGFAQLPFSLFRGV